MKNKVVLICLGISIALLSINSMLLTNRCDDLESQIEIYHQESFDYVELKYRDVLDDQRRQDADDLNQERQIEAIWDTLAENSIPIHYGSAE